MAARLKQSNDSGTCCDCTAATTACAKCGDACGSPTIALQCATANGTRYGFPAWDGGSRLFLILGGVLTYTGTQTCSDYYNPDCMPEAATVSVALRADATWSLSQATFEDGSACSCADGAATSSASITGYTITDVVGCENCSEALTGCLAYIALAALPIVTPCNCNGTVDPYPNCFPLAYTIASTTATILTLSAAGPTPYFAGCSGGLVDSGTMTLTLTSEYTVAEFTDEVVAKAEETLASCSDAGYLEDAFFEGARLDYEVGTTGNSPTISTCDTLLFSYTRVTIWSRAERRNPQPGGANRAMRDSSASGGPVRARAAARGKQTTAGSPKGAPGGAHQSAIVRPRPPQRAHAAVPKSAIKRRHSAQGRAELLETTAANRKPSGANRAVRDSSASGGPVRARAAARGKQTTAGSPKGTDGNPYQSQIANRE